MMSKTLYDTDEFIANSNIIEERFPNITSELLELLKDVDNNNPETFSDYYVNQYQRHKKKNPLLAFDYLIEGLSNKYLSFDKNSSVLLLKVILESSCSHTFDQEDLKWDNVFRSSWWKSKDDQRKAAFFILRIMVEGLEDIIDIPNSRLKVTELLFY